MTTKVDTMIDALVGREGRYSNHPSDRGGPTMYGITQQVARAYGYAGDMRALPRPTAVQIYRQRYWIAPGFDDVANCAPLVAEEMFDTGVNMGPAVAGKFLQRALNLLNRGASDYPDIAEDGQVGALTIDCLRRFIGKRGLAGEKVLLKALDGFQVDRYAAITEGRPANEAFFYGWLANRVGPLA